VDCSSTRVVRLGQVTQEHCRGGNALASPSALLGVGPPNRSVALGLTGATPIAARRSMRTGRSVVHRVRWCSWRLMRPLSS